MTYVCSKKSHFGLWCNFLRINNNQIHLDINALKKFGQIYMSEHLDECLEQGVDKEEISKNLKPILNGIFKL